MNRLAIYELAQILVEKNGLTREEAELFVSKLFDVIRRGLEHDSIVKVKGLGTFKIIGVEARESVNVNTGERVVIDSHGKITFTPDATMKELVNKPFSQFETVVLNEGIEFDDMTGSTDGAVVSDISENVETQQKLPTNDSVEQKSSAISNALGDIRKAIDSLEDTSGSNNEESLEGNYVQTTTEQLLGIENVPHKDVVAADNHDAPEHVTNEAVKTAPDNNEDESIIVESEENVPDTVTENTSDENMAGSNGFVRETNESGTPIVILSEASVEGPKEVASESVESDREDCMPDDEDEVRYADDEDATEQKSTSKWLWATVCSLGLLLPIAFYGGYIYGRHTVPEGQKKMVVMKHIYATSDKDMTLETAATDSTVTTGNHVRQDSADITAKTVKADADDEIKRADLKSVQNDNVAAPDKLEDNDYSQYEKLDNRVRTGAYRIVGTDHVRTVKSGETVERIARRTLGEGMECYIEVYNGLGRDAKLKEGQRLKIPKLKLKRATGRK